MDSGFQGTPYEYWLLTEYNNGGKAEVLDLDTLSMEFGSEWVSEFSRLMSKNFSMYEGDDICFEEMPQGCIISAMGTDGKKWMGYNIRVSSTRDALALIDSLQRMIETQKGE